jgi:ABC-2 type transport system ATP-binding protein
MHGLGNGRFAAAISCDARDAGDAIGRIDRPCKRYGRTLTLDELGFAVRPNEVFALFGPNGAGKSTLIHILCTILMPICGTLADLDVVKQPLKTRRHPGVVLKEPSVDDWLTVFENLNFHGLVHRVPFAVLRRRIDELLNLAELERACALAFRGHEAPRGNRALTGPWLCRTRPGRTHRQPRCAIARAHLGLSHATAPRTCADHYRYPHYIEEAEDCDRVRVIDHGHVMATDKPAALKAAYGCELLPVLPRDEPPAGAIRASCPGALSSDDSAIVIETGPDAPEAFLQQFGTRVGRLSIDNPGLESVFRSLTGRELRDQPAGRRGRIYAFGRRGNEHTR